MVYFTDIQPTEHYTQEHKREVPWPKVVEIILTTKNPRKKGENFEIKSEGYYLLFRVKDNTLFVVNAKRTR